MLELVASGARMKSSSTSRTRPSSTRRRSGSGQRGQAAARRRTARFRCVCSDRNITKIFEITGLDRVFTIYPTRAEALERLDSKRLHGLAELRPLRRFSASRSRRRVAVPVVWTTAPTSPAGRSCSSASAALAIRSPMRERLGRSGLTLDASFGPSRAQGFQESTIRRVVHDQIYYLRPRATRTSR